MTRQDITSIKIERRHGGEDPVWNITMLVTPSVASDQIDYARCICLAEQILREAKNLSVVDGWYVSHANLMAWSGSVINDNPEYRGATTPHEFRITLDMERTDDD